MSAPQMAGSQEMAEGYLAAMFAALENHECKCDACQVLRGISERMRAKFTGPQP